MATRTNVYVDGFNLYYGALKNMQYKWLDLQDLFCRIRAHDEVRCVYYFTARIDGAHRPHQDAYLRALATRPRVRIVFGKFKPKVIQCRVRPCDYGGAREFSVPQEKRTDINIAVQLLDDAYQDQFDTAVIVSGDSDLVPAVMKVKARFPAKTVVVYVPSRDPARGAAVELRTAADKDRNLPLGVLRISQLRRQVPDGAGGLIEKPADW